MDGCVVGAAFMSALQGVRNQHRVARSIIRVRTAQLETGPSGLVSKNLRSNAIRHTVDALASRGDEGRDKLR